MSTDADDRRFASIACSVLDRYAAAFQSFDGRAVAGFYAEPSVIVDQRGATHWATRAEVERNMVALCAIYRDRGLLQTRPAIARAMAQGDRLGYVDVTWSMRWSDDSASSFRTGYLLQDTAGAWQIRLCSAYEETL